MPIDVAVVVADEGRRETVAGALAERDGVAPVSTGGPANPPDGTADVDAAVVGGTDVAVPGDVPRVVLSSGPPEAAAGTAGYVRATGDDADYGRLADQLRLAAGREGDAARREKIERLHESTAEVVTARDEDELFEMAVAAAENVLAFDVCYLLVRDGDRFVPAASSSTETDSGLQPVDLDHGLTGHTYETGEPYLVEDLASDPRADAVHGDYGSGISVPVGDWGVFQATAKEAGAFDRDDVELAELLLSYVNETYRRIGVERELRERRERIERLHESTAEVVGARDEDELFDLTVEAAENVVGLEVCVIAVGDEGGEHLTVEATSDSEYAPEVGTVVTVEMGAIGRTYRTGEPILVEDAETDEHADPHEEAYRSALSVPIGDVGVLQAISTEAGAYGEEDLRLTELLASHVAETLNRVRAENRLRERESTLAEERDRLAALFENVPDPVAAFELEDGKPIVRDVNGPFEETFGWSADQLRGENIDEYVVPPEEDTRADELNDELLAGQRLRTTGRRMTADGPRDFLLHVVPHEVGERNVEGYAIYTDITDQKRRERALERQNERLDRFASIVSHDLRNPLGIAQGRLELASEADDPADATDHFDDVATALDRMERMIDELLTLARHGDVVGETEPVELGSVAREAWAAVETGGADLRIAADPVVAADRERFCELLGNLFRNSIEHGRPGERPAPAGDGDDVDLTVEVGAWDRDGEAGFYVADDGVGVPADERDRVLEDGYSTEEDGTGFGLSIVTEIAQAHGWSVTVAESAAGGARFEFAVDGDQIPLEGASGRGKSP